MSHREEAERLLSHFVTSHPREAAQVHALLAIAEALRAPVTECPPSELSPDEVLAVAHIRNRHIHGTHPLICPMCALSVATEKRTYNIDAEQMRRFLAGSHRGNGCGCGTPNRSPWLLRVWTTSDGDSHSTPHHRTDVYLCSGHVPTLPIEHNTSMSSADPDDRAEYDRQIRPLLQFDGAPSAVITHFYLSGNAP